jgi:hypothetical protein
MKLSTIALASMLAIAGCGKNVKHSDHEMKMASVQSQLDSGHYEAAIQKLEVMRIASPENEEMKLLHSYAGAGSFEAMKVISVWKEVEQILKDIRKENEARVEKSLKANVDAMAGQLERVLEPIPELSAHQKKRLNQAIALYQELGFKVETAGKYTNFKWGTLHVYRLAVTVKDLVKEARRVQAESKKVDLKAIEKVVLPRMKIMGQDIFMAYKLFSNSFDKIKKITDSVDIIIAKTIKDDNFKLKINTLAKSEGEFFKSLLKDNVSAASVLVRKLGDIYHEKGVEARVKDSLKANLPSEQEVRDSAKKIEVLVRIFIEKFTDENPQIEDKLKSIFTEDLKRDLIAAAKNSIKVKNTSPLKALLESKKPEIEILNSYFMLLKSEVKESDLEENIQVEIDGLKKKVKLELLKEELEKIGEDLKPELKVVEAGAEALLHRNEEQLVERQKFLKGEINDLKEYLGNLSKGLKESLNAENPDEEKMDQIIEETKELVES